MKRTLLLVGLLTISFNSNAGVCSLLMKSLVDVTKTNNAEITAKQTTEIVAKQAVKVAAKEADSVDTDADDTDNNVRFLIKDVDRPLDEDTKARLYQHLFNKLTEVESDAEKDQILDQINQLDSM